VGGGVTPPDNSAPVDEWPDQPADPDDGKEQQGLARQRHSACEAAAEGEDSWTKLQL